MMIAKISLHCILNLWKNLVPVIIKLSFFLFLFAIYLKLTITIYEKLQTKCTYTIKNSLNKWLIQVNYPE